MWTLCSKQRYRHYQPVGMGARDRTGAPISTDWQSLAFQANRQPRSFKQMHLLGLQVTVGCLLAQTLRNAEMQTALATMSSVHMRMLELALCGWCGRTMVACHIQVAMLCGLEKATFEHKAAYGMIEPHLVMPTAASPNQMALAGQVGDNANGCAGGSA